MMNLPLLVVLFVASFFRLFQLGSLPISLFGDEVDVGYHAWSLITTGKDYMGHFLPTYIQSLAEWRAPLLMYITAPFVGLFGTSAFVIRLPVALLGISSVFLVYLFVKKLLQNEKVALISSLILAITPWHLHYSRASFEAVPLLFLELLGAYLFISGKEFLSLVPFVLTFYTYSTANIFTPLLVISLCVIFRPKVFVLKNLPKLIFPFVLILPMVYNIILGPAAGRFKLISVFNDPKIIDAVIIQRTDPWVKSSPVEVFFHNKYFAYATAIGQNYITAFSPEFLFLYGDPNFRQSVGGQGELLWVTLPFFLYGLFLILKGIPKKSSTFLLTWLLISPLASSLTQGGGTHATRLFLMLLPLVVISGLGLAEIISKFKKQALVWILIGLLFSFSFANFWHRYTAHYRFESAALWQSGYADIFKQLHPYLQGQQNIYINNTNQPSLIRFALLAGFPPSQFLKDFHGDNPDSFENEFFKGFRFGDRFYFGQVRRLELLGELLKPGDIYMAAQGKEIPGDWDWSKTPSKGFKVIGFVRDVLGQPQYYLLEKVSE